VVYGGPHTSAPSLRKYGVEPGDAVHVVMLKDGALHLIATLLVREIVSVGDYLVSIGLPDSVARLPLFELEERLDAERPDLGHRLPQGCVDEAAVGEGTEIRFDRRLAPQTVERIEFVSRRGQRRRIGIEGGRVRPMSIQGHLFRLSPESAKLLSEEGSTTP
jgi:hypothetical protein